MKLRIISKEAYDGCIPVTVYIWFRNMSEAVSLANG